MIPRTIGRRSKYPIAIACVLIALSGCGRTRTSDPAEYARWLNDPGNGLVQSRTINGFQMTVKYLPSDYRAYQELHTGQAAGNRAQIERQCEATVAFLLTIAPLGASHGGVVAEPEVFARAGLMLNDEIREHLELRAAGRTYMPIITALDNDGGMSRTMTVTAVFADETGRGALPRANEYDLTLDDSFLGMGISHFQFRREAIDSRMHFDLQ